MILPDSEFSQQGLQRVLNSPVRGDSLDTEAMIRPVYQKISPPVRHVEMVVCEDVSRVTEGDCQHPPRKRKKHRGNRQGNEPFPGVQNDETAWPLFQVKVPNLIRQMVRVHQYSRGKSQRNGQQFAGERPDCRSCPSRQQRVICRPQIR